jgi:long-chain acyl-CoA synthetase
VVCRAGQSLDYASVKAFALAHAAAYQHPRRVEFIDELPLAGTHKVDRATLIGRARGNEHRTGWSR